MGSFFQIVCHHSLSCNNNRGGSKSPDPPAANVSILVLSQAVPRLMCITVELLLPYIILAVAKSSIFACNTPPPAKNY